MFHRICSEYNLYLFVFLQNLLKSRVGYVKFKFPNCSFLATVLWYEPLPLHKLLITTQPGLHRIKRVRVTTGALCRTSKSFKSDTKSSKICPQQYHKKRKDNTRNVGRSRKGLAGQQENRESKKQTKTKNGDGDYEDAIKERNFGWKATSCQTVVKGQSLIIFND